MSIFGDRRLKTLFVFVLIIASCVFLINYGRNSCQYLTDSAIKDSVLKMSLDSAVTSNNGKIHGRFDNLRGFEVEIDQIGDGKDDLLAKFLVREKDSNHVLYSGLFFKNCEVQWLLD